MSAAARGRLAALLLVAEDSLQRHQRVKAPPLRPTAPYARWYAEGHRLLAARDAYADAYSLLIEDELELGRLLPTREVLDHARQQLLILAGPTLQEASRG